MNQLPILVALTTLALGACGGSSDELPTPTMAADSSHAPAVTDGMQEVRDKDGKLLMQGMVRDGLRQGEWTSHFPDGSIRSRASFSGGIQEGATEVFHDNGSLYYRGQYHRDKPVGNWLFYDREGVQQRLVRYDSLGNQLEQR